MLETILKLVTAGATIFTEERRRHYSDKLHDLLKELDDAEKARHPHYSDSRIAKARKNLDMFVVAYAAEFEEATAELKKKAGL